MRVDVLQDVLATVRLSASDVFVNTLSAPWGFSASPNKNDVLFMVILEGNCVLELDESDCRPQPLTGGDIVLMSRGSGHVLRDSPQTPVHSLEELSARQKEARGPRAKFALGCYRVAAGGRTSFSSVLPPLIRLEREEYSNLDEINLLVRLFLAEAGKEGACQSVILSRLAEVFFMQILRYYSLDPKKSFKGWLKALSDPAIAATLQAIHADPASNWSVATLAREATLSRSSFAERFNTIVGEPPLRYVQRWRMQKAAHLLSEKELPLKTIMGSSGYSSESAFRKAFLRWFGVLPSKYEDFA